MDSPEDMVVVIMGSKRDLGHVQKIVALSEIRDNDHKYGHRFSAIAKDTGIKEIRIPFGAPNANVICERFIGTLRRDCLDHMLILNQQHLHAVTREFVEYYNAPRPHQGIGQAIPIPLSDQPDSGRIVALPVLGGLHHDYRRAV